MQRTTNAVVLISLLLNSVATASALPTFASFKLNNNNLSQPSLHSMGVVGDLNHDGHPDIGAGFYAYSATNTAVGILNIFTSYSSSPSWSIQGTNTDDYLGYSVISLGDVNGDGTDDFAVSVIRDSTTCASVLPSPGSQYTGSVYVISGATHGVLYSLSGNINGGFGVGMAALSDIDGDGVRDFVVSAATQNQTGSTHCSVTSGELLMYSGASGNLIAGHSVGTTTGRGARITNVGDTNNDGYDDFAFDEGAGTSVLAVYSGKDSTLFGYVTVDVKGISRIGDVNADSHADIAVMTTSGVHIYSGNGLSQLGTISVPNITSVAGIGDLDGDGVGEIAVTSQDAVGGGPGLLQIFSGSTRSVLAKFVLMGQLDISDAKLVPLGLIDGDALPDFGLSRVIDRSLGGGGVYVDYVFLSGTPNPHDPLLFTKDSFYRIGNAFYNF